jgi:hypothetical protein
MNFPLEELFGDRRGTYRLPKFAYSLSRFGDSKLADGGSDKYGQIETSRLVILMDQNARIDNSLNQQKQKLIYNGNTVNILLKLRFLLNIVLYSH